MQTSTYAFRRIGNIAIFEAQTEYEVDRLALLYHSVKSRKEKAGIRVKYLILVKQENERMGFKCFNTII